MINYLHSRILQLCLISADLLHLHENTFDWKCISTHPNPNPKTLTLSLTLKHNNDLGLTKWRYFLRKYTDTGISLHTYRYGCSITLPASQKFSVTSISTTTASAYGRRRPNWALDRKCRTKILKRKIEVNVNSSSTSAQVCFYNFTFCTYAGIIFYSQLILMINIGRGETQGCKPIKSAGWFQRIMLLEISIAWKIKNKNFLKIYYFKFSILPAQLTRSAIHQNILSIATIKLFLLIFFSNFSIISCYFF